MYLRRRWYWGNGSLWMGLWGSKELFSLAWVHAEDFYHFLSVVVNVVELNGDFRMI